MEDTKIRRHPLPPEGGVLDEFRDRIPKMLSPPMCAQRVDRWADRYRRLCYQLEQLDDCAKAIREEMVEVRRHRNHARDRLDVLAGAGYNPFESGEPAEVIEKAKHYGGRDGR